MKFDVVVIGGGHAGIEAAAASARLGARTALLSLRLDRVGVMSCNPAIGGLAKGQLVKEVDALGGLMGRITDLSAIQYRILNSSKGPAVRSSRCQCDRDLYSVRARELLFADERVVGVEGEADQIIVTNHRVEGILLKNGTVLKCSSVVIAAGTFLRGTLFTGLEVTDGGRVGDAPAKTLSSSLELLGFKLRRLKTGTPPRIRKQSIDFSVCEIQNGDDLPQQISFYAQYNRFPVLPQMPCYITYTSEATHEFIRKGLDRSPLYTGLISGIGPRYCPSIEDKVVRFSDKLRHQIFLEPEGLNCDEIYVNGVSTSLPKDVQDQFIRTIVGLEKAEFIRYGYAVEYDSIYPEVLKRTLESKDIHGLFFAGQINGTSGYEEAAGQGLIAGLNAALLVQGRDPFIVARNEGYIGVMIDDLITLGTDEPYRMFTSRAEFRLLLREDNADLRLSERALLLGALSPSDGVLFQTKKEAIDRLRARLTATRIKIPQDSVTAEVYLRRPEVSWAELVQAGVDPFDEVSGKEFSPQVVQQVEIQIKYAGYIQRDVDLMSGLKSHEDLKIPIHFDYTSVAGLSTEVCARLMKARPETVGQAGRLRGVTPAALVNLMLYLKAQNKTG